VRERQKKVRQGIMQQKSHKSFRKEISVDCTIAMMLSEGDESQQDYDDNSTTKEMPQIFSRFLPACLDSDAKNNRGKVFFFSSSFHINAIMLI
jgi:hypothetical protein